MMVVERGHLYKMKVDLCSPVQYHLVLSDKNLDMNRLIGQSITLSHTGKIHCIQCQRNIKKTFQSGYCYVCMQRLYECGNCVIHPEKCRIEHEPCPVDDWAHNQCHASHVVYLANTSGLKVGITRESNVPTRWIDQGAMQALPMIHTSNRYQAGLVEVMFKDFVADRTNWRTMLKQDSIPMDLLVQRDRLMGEVGSVLDDLLERYQGQITLMDAEKYAIRFPIESYPEKIKSCSFDKVPEINGTLLGIKGQYLILDCGVLNIRKFGGYEIDFLVR